MTDERSPAGEDAAVADSSAERSDPSSGPDASPTLAERLAQRVEITLPTRHNPKLADIVDAVNRHDRLYALWVAANTTAVDRLGMSDHGPVHVRIVANSALRILRLLVAGGVVPNAVSDYGLEGEDAEIIVALAALLHDVGMSIHRTGHEEFSLFVARPIIDELLEPEYPEAIGTIVHSEILHAIISHRSGGQPLTVEGGVLRVADALDMAGGRSRIPFTAGATGIHAVSAAAIERVAIDAGASKPVRIRVEMGNSAGVFQVDELLRRKLKGSGLEPHVAVEAVVEAETETRLVQRFEF
ncbi:MAG: HD domain-containing protein [Gemmatimonadetes bacterium]|nr:HD domain-containing protein [Gemmatimonadota bacterium]